MNKKVLLIKYGEISLRKGNRALYERRLMDAIRARLRNFAGDAIHVMREQGRILVEDTRGDIDGSSVLPMIQSIFGIAGICLCVKTTEDDLKNLKVTALDYLREVRPNHDFSFKVETKRGNKQYPLTSNEISAEVGGYLLEHEPGLSVDVHHPEMIVWIEIRNYCYIYTESIRGEGGLPYGSSGKGMLLLSGGIDSPVAGYLTARRGVEIIPVYFHSPPYTSDRALDKVLDLTRRLAAYTGGCELWVVPFTETQLLLHERVRPERLTLLLKRAMLHIASLLGKKEKALCLITGDSIGQVASQTIHSLAAVDSASAFPVLRPLAAMDKQQIINTAQRIGTYDISIRPYEDCCTLFVADHPECKPRTDVIENIEKYIAELPDYWKAAADNAVKYEIK